MSTVPARTAADGIRKPFYPGHGYTLKSGARSPRVYGELAQRLAAGLVEERPELENYPEAVATWATVEAQAALMRRHFDEVGIIDPVTTEPRKSLSWLSHFEKRAIEARKPLGLDPMSEAALAKERAAAATLAVDLQGFAERGRAALAAREAAGIAPAPDLAGQVLAEEQARARERELQAEMEWLI